MAGSELGVPVGEVPCFFGDGDQPCGAPSTHATAVHIPTGTKPVEAYVLTCEEHARFITIAYLDAQFGDAFEEPDDDR